MIDLISTDPLSKIFSTTESFCSVDASVQNVIIKNLNHTKSWTVILSFFCCEHFFNDHEFHLLEDENSKF